jgi:ABC-2 type transport system ATP-binding protein
VDRKRNINKLFEKLTKKNINITSMRNKTNRLEELFLKLLNNKD